MPRGAATPSLSLDLNLLVVEHFRRNVVCRKESMSTASRIGQMIDFGIIAYSLMILGLSSGRRHFRSSRDDAMRSLLK
jgi:hypothetical protein